MGNYTQVSVILRLEVMSYWFVALRQAFTKCNRVLGTKKGGFVGITSGGAAEVELLHHAGRFDPLSLCAAIACGENLSKGRISFDKGQ